MKRWFIPAAILAVAAAIWFFQSQLDRSQTATPPAPQGGAPAAGGQFVPDPGPAPESHNAAAGLHWTVPSGWTVGEQRSMRVGTYLSPALGGDPEGGECAVFYFGPSQGGDVESNIQRWIGQFEPGATSSRSSRKVADLEVSLVEIKGTYLAPSGPMMESTGSKKGYLLLGAIAQGPQGNVFFKFTGPEKSVNAARKDFEGMISSIHGD
uniref:Uncharacterized protein n=1 Tax=Eiseniibacteriota bacterium TaxID=2212470 RepID=A0A832I1H3_UNCEI